MSTARLRIVSTVLAHGDAPETANPLRRFTDWKRDITVEDAVNPQNTPYDIAPGEELTVFDGTRAISLDGTTVMSLALISGTTDKYRFRHTSGADPVFRTARNFSANGGTVTCVVNANNTLTMTLAGGTFTGIVAGDTLWIPGSEESIASPFSVLNQGFWLVLSMTATVLVLQRVGDFQGTNEGPISITAVDQMRAFSSAGVQVGDKLEVSAGFASVTQKNYTVTAVTSKYVDIQSTTALPNESGISPGAAGFIFYRSAKRYLRVESDQEVVVRLNGDTGNTQRLTPWVAGDVALSGEYTKTGPTWTLKIFNRSLVTAQVVVIAAE